MSSAEICTPAQAPRAASAEGLRLALFSGNYNYTRDGANQALNRLVSYLEDEGAEVRVYSPTTHTPAFEPSGELVSVPSLSLPGRPEYRMAFGLPRAAREDVIRFAPTVIHLSAPDLLGVQAKALGRRLGVPVVSSLHTRFETYLSYYGFGWLRPAAERYLRNFYAGCDRVLAPNGPLAELLQGQRLGAQVRVWGRGVDRMQFSPLRRDLAWRRGHGIEDDEVAVLFLGRLVLEKGLDVFARTLALLEQSGRRVRAVVVGDGPARGWFAARLPNGLFTGALYGPELGQAVASADILFNPSQTEAFGNATLEAMAAGLAVVCPEAPSTRALVTHASNGILVRAQEPAAYAEAIDGLVGDVEARRRIGRAARRASENYDWAETCSAVLETYREVGGVADPRRRRVLANDWNMEARTRLGAARGRG